MFRKYTRDSTLEKNPTRVTSVANILRDQTNSKDSTGAAVEQNQSGSRVEAGQRIRDVKRTNTEEDTANEAGSCDSGLRDFRRT